MLLRRVGSQRGGLAVADPQPQPLSAASEHDTSSSSSSSNHEPPRGGLGGLLRRATSLRGGLDSSSNHSRGQQPQRCSLDQQQQQQSKDGNSSSMDASMNSTTTHKEDPTTTTCTPAAAATAPLSPPDTASTGSLRNIFRRAASLRTMGSNRKLEVQNKKSAEEALQPVLIMTDENHGKIVFQELEPEEEKEATALLQLDDLSTFDDDKSSNKKHRDSRRRRSSNNSYNISNMLHASMPDLSTASSSGCSSLESSGRGSLDSPPSHRKSFQPFVTTATGVCSSSSTPASPPLVAGHYSFSGTPSSSWTKNAAGASGNHNDFCLHMSASELDFTNGEAAAVSPQEKEQQVGKAAEDATSNNRRGLALGGRLRTFFQRTKSGRTLPTPEQDAASAASALSENNQSFDNVFGNMSLPELEEMEKLNHKDIMNHLNSILSQHQHDDEEKTEERKQEEERNEVMGGLMDIVEEYEAYEGFESANRFYSSDEDEKYSYNENASSDDGLVDEIDNFMFESEDSPVEGGETDEDDDDDEVFYDMPDSASSPSSQFDIVFTPNEAYHEEREYDDLELFYEEQTFAGVGGSMLLGQAAELMTVHEYDEEEYSSDDDSCSI